VAEYDPVRLLRVLADHGVDFVVIGGVAARLQGAPILTQDVDVTPSTDAENLARLAAALRAVNARLRSPRDTDGVDFPVEARFLAAARSWTLVTDAGDLDLVFAPTGANGYADVVAGADRLTVADDPPLEVYVASLAAVIRSKEAAGRDKDRAALPLLRRTLEELERRPPR
jgi:hypothetical protein